MATNDFDTATEHLALGTVVKVLSALREAQTLFDGLNCFDMSQAYPIEMGEKCIGVPADTIHAALVERGLAVTREAIGALDPSDEAAHG